MAQIIIANLNQAPAQKSEIWRPGDIFSAMDYHTMFFNSAEELTAIDLDSGARRKLRSWGSFVVKIQDVFQLNARTRLATLDIVEKSVFKPYDAILNYQGIVKHSYEMVMTLPFGSAVEVGMQFNVGFLSIIEPLGEGNYKLLHDFPVTRSGPRFELFDDDPDEYIRASAEEIAGDS